MTTTQAPGATQPVASGRSVALATTLPDAREEPDAPSGTSVALATELPDAPEGDEDSAAALLAALDETPKTEMETW